MKGIAGPFSEIRRTGFAGPRRIFAEVSLPSGSENSFLADLPPGNHEMVTGKSGALAEEQVPPSHGSRFMREPWGLLGVSDNHSFPGGHGFLKSTLWEAM